ncbi:MAG: hypothetical protein KY467_17445 [Gemmatimonadetes bacterium]|nr:hypothetical protein [Gemmatimonadota bacterium]
MRGKRFLMLVCANAVLLLVNLGIKVTPLQGSEEAGWADCCKFSTEGVGFCCDGCCWWDKCDSSLQCPVHPT